jgi:malate dehydrogenase (oxaloacetate-decarboxylating)
LVFPGIFRGALDAKATKISEEMKVAAARAIASVIHEDELSENYIIPNSFNPKVAQVVADAVKKIAVESNLVKQ